MRSQALTCVACWRKCLSWSSNSRLHLLMSVSSCAYDITGGMLAAAAVVEVAVPVIEAVVPVTAVVAGFRPREKVDAATEAGGAAVTVLVAAAPRGFMARPKVQAVAEVVAGAAGVKPAAAAVAVLVAAVDAVKREAAGAGWPDGAVAAGAGVAEVFTPKEKPVCAAVPEVVVITGFVITDPKVRPEL